MLKRIEIHNYRSCLQTTLDLDTNLSVLIGANGSGKTNILQAIMFLHKLANQVPRISGEDSVTVNANIKATFNAQNFKSLLNASVDAYTDESNNDIVRGSREKWTITYPRGAKVRLECPLSIVAELRDGPSRLHVPPSKWPINRRNALQFHFARHMLKATPAPIVDHLRNIGTFCKNIKYYGASQFTNPGSCPVSFEIEQDAGRSRLFRLRGHARILYDMYSAKQAEDATSYSQFMNIVGSQGLKLIDDLTFHTVKTSSIDYLVRVGGKVERRRKSKLLIVPQFRIGKQRLSPNQLSEGTFKTLALLFHVVTADSSAMLIEEPEVCVHQGLLSSILELVKTYSRQKIIILSTHSDYVLDQVAPENVHTVTFEKGKGTIVRNIRKTMNAKEYTALRTYLREQGNLGEYWRETGFGERQ